MKLGCWPTYEHKHKLLTPDAAQTVYLRAVPHSRIGTPPPYWIIAHGFASPQRSGSVSDVGVARLHFSSTNHFPERICAVIKRTGLLVEIIIKKLNNVKIRLFHISIQCYLFWKSDEKWVWFLKPVQAGWHAHLEHFSTTGSQRRVLHINCTCIMSYFFFARMGHMESLTGRAPISWKRKPQVGCVCMVGLDALPSPTTGPRQTGSASVWQGLSGRTWCVAVKIFTAVRLLVLIVDSF